MSLLDVLLPREVEFFTYLNDQMDVLCQTCQLFEELVTNIEKMSEKELQEKLSEIKDLESKGDKIEMMVIDKLHTTFITPIDREDIHTIVLDVDHAIDIINSAAQKIKMYNIRKIPKNVIKFSKIIVEASSELRKLIKHLADKDALHEIQRQVSLIHHLENRADELFYSSMADLFSGDKNAVEVIKFKELYEHLENAVDSFHWVSKLIRGIVVKHG